MNIADYSDREDLSSVDSDDDSVIKRLPKREKHLVDEDDDDDVDADDEDDDDIYNVYEADKDAADKDAENNKFLTQLEDDDEEYNGEEDNDDTNDNNVEKQEQEQDNGEDDEDDDDDDDVYLQKFNDNIAKNILLDFHPECKKHNYDEIRKLTQVTRDAFGIIHNDPFHKTNPFLTIYEKARILGQRATQINSGSLPMVKIPETMIDAQLIAEMELEQKKIPFIIKRTVPGGCIEYWKVSDLENNTF